MILVLVILVLCFPPSGSTFMSSDSSFPDLPKAMEHPAKVEPKLMEDMEENPYNFKIPNNKRGELLRSIKAWPMTMRQLVALCVWLQHISPSAGVKDEDPRSLRHPETRAIFLDKVSRSLLPHLFGGVGTY